MIRNEFPDSQPGGRNRSAASALNVSSGRNGATRDKSPDHMLTSRYASGFANALMSKNVRLYLNAVQEQDGPTTIGTATAALWERFAAAEPGADFIRVFFFAGRS
ncbi:NAD-binding protein [Thermomonospora amylolytica]|uniref:NAD-binding protein n=1 Tax=Thermomonospora amylolytica TaxID=1411117 RepID=UPI000E6B5670|nr:NAD-binding protein [Thermomonospora amylolytica]